MRKIFVIVLVLLFAAGVSYARDTGFPTRGDVFLQVRTITNDAATDYGHTHVTTSASLVYRVTMTSNTANTYVQLFNSAGSAGYDTDKAMLSALGATVYASGGSKVVKADLGATTAGQSYQYSYDPPLRFEQGILAGFTGADNTFAAGIVATAVIEYTPAE